MRWRRTSKGRNDDDEEDEQWKEQDQEDKEGDKNCVRSHPPQLEPPPMVVMAKSDGVPIARCDELPLQSNPTLHAN